MQRYSFDNTACDYPDDDGDWVMAEDAQRLQDERDALAAHLERMTAKIGELIASSRVDGRDFHEILKDAPDTSLAYREALAGAEALRRMAIRFDDFGMLASRSVQRVLKNQEHNYRQQAERIKENPKEIGNDHN